jgi:hypothetical protein
LVLKNTLFFFFLFFLIDVYSQEKERVLPESRVGLQQDSTLLSGDLQRVTSKNIALFAPEDIGVLSQKIAGITLKNYGGIGGMKTIAYRGISGTNTAVVLDGFALQNTMVGQLDLSNLQVDNVDNISFISSSQTDELLPISALMQGNTLSINTFQNNYINDTLEVRFTSKYGSFGMLDNFTSFKRGFKHSYLSIYGKLRSFEGVYPYEIENGDWKEKRFRKNNSLAEGYTGINFTKFISEHLKLHSSIHFNQSKRGLPGAVILYNETANQSLNQQNTYWNLETEWNRKKARVRFYNSLNYGYLNYIDPDYLNNTGGLNQWYYNTINQSGISFNQKNKDSSISFFGGVEYTYSTLTASQQYAYSPSRFHLQSLLGIKSVRKDVLFIFQLGNHSLQNQQGITKSITNAWTSLVHVEKRVYVPWVGIPRTWFKQTFRMPSFSEMYYNSIGNKALKPELTLQWNIGTSYRLFENSFHISLDAYYNKIDNKILAIPTKNLFVWSIQNIGKVQIVGIDLLLKKEWKFSENVEFNSAINYSFQKIEDISDKKGTTFKNQLAYFPKHTFQADFTLTVYKKMGFYLSNSTLSSRYVLNENSLSNLLKGFSTVDVTFFYKMSSSDKHSLKLHGTIKNCLNTSYQYISYFVMPGRNYLISLSYAFN